MSHFVFDPTLPTSTFSAETTSKLNPVRIGIASRSPNPMPYFVALERGFFHDEGLAVEIILMKAIQVIQSQLGGNIDFGVSTGTAVSAAVNGIEFFKGPHLDIGRERHRLAERVYDAAVQGYLLTGSVDEKLQREMIAGAARRIKPTQPITPDRVFDFSFVQKVLETLRSNRHC